MLIAFIGYYGAVKYNSCQVLTYAVYQITNNLMRLGLTIYAYVMIKENGEEDQYNNLTGQLVITILLVMLGLYIARFSYKLYSSLKRLTPDQIINLKCLDYPVQIFYW